MKIPSEARRKLPADEAAKKLTSSPPSSPVKEVTATTMSKLLRKKGAEAFLGVINEAEVVELQELSANSKEDRFHVSGRQKTVLSKFYEQHGLKVDQFVDNLIDCKVTNEEPKLTAIRNRLYINSNQGREPFERMYQRTIFSFKW